MKVQLPLENWADLLPFVPRLQLVEIVKQLNDRQFAKILQFFLTEVGQITLGYLRIVAPREYDPIRRGPIVEVRRQFWPFREVPPPSDVETKLPEGPMPTNVKDFKLIELSYFDPSVANFLLQFQQEPEPGKSLLDNVNLWFPSFISLTPRDDTSLMQNLVGLMPIVGSINCMSIWNLHHMRFGRSGLGPASTASQLLTTMLTNARILEIRGDMAWSIFSWCDWLYAPRNDGKPRALRLSDYFPNFGTKDLIERIRKDFSEAIHPVSFFVYVRVMENVEWPNICFCLDNGQQTNERLVVKTIDPPPMDPFHFRAYPKKLVLISRYPVAANQEWIEANEKEIMKWNVDDQNRLIRTE